ncbi:SDR family oxidoreductase [Acetobacter conturbans]|uniref:NADH-ubiquinone oxidoreductase n=1 Tax=Acetobacter conturbans TaxID=1737472 RepID=A0ABX0JV98_9PROT|nr:NADH-ubiquinone oxidoreductase [Acetobacter conturbans]NHN87146.1 NADH-ubiquinone oxidoreductase [Acetobacter conturbans]
MSEPVHIIGASGRSGTALRRALLARGRPVIPVVRDRTRYETSLATDKGSSSGPLLHPPRIADLTGPSAPLATALADAKTIVCTAHARNIPALIRAAPETARLVCLGSTRKFTHWPDSHGNGVLHGEQALLASGRNGVILHPTMIYGAQGENNVQRLAALLRRLPLIPLPGGGTSLVQPIHQNDVTASIIAALDHDWNGPHSLVIAGATPVTYRDFVLLVARAAGLAPRPVIPVPARALIAAASVLRHVPGFPAIGPDEIRRLLEDKNFDIIPMIETLGVKPRSLLIGLGQLFSADTKNASPSKT